jgi:hypothetical protein
MREDPGDQTTSEEEHEGEAERDRNTSRVNVVHFRCYLGTLERVFVINLMTLIF